MATISDNETLAENAAPTSDKGTDKPKRCQKVLRLEILKPANGDLSWSEIDKLLFHARYRVFRLANLIVSEAYLQFHLKRSGQSELAKTETPNRLNRRLREMLRDEKVADEELDRYSATGALPDTVVGALSQYKTRAVTAPSKWREVVRGKSSLPTFRLNMPIPVRCDKEGHRRLERMPSGDVELDLVICRKPYPRVILKTGKLNGGQRAILDRLLDNTSQLDGYRQRCFEIKHDDRSNVWSLFVTYDFPAPEKTRQRQDVVVGVDVGYACPLYAAISNGHARLGWRQFASLSARIRSLQTQVMARRRQMLTGGRSSLTADTARCGHGRKRRLQPIETLEGRINDAYRTLNHQLSTSVIKFAQEYGAGIIQIENLKGGLKDKLAGTFLGSRWRYHQLSQFLEYKAKEAGIELKQINPRFTSRRCSQCGFINVEFTREARDREKRKGFVTRFQCPSCEFTSDPDYNAARNLAVLDIEERIAQQCRDQQIASAL